MSEEIQQWYSVEYFDKDAGNREPLEYPDEGGWVTCRACDGTLKHAEHAFGVYSDKYEKVRIVRHEREIVKTKPLTEPGATNGG